MTHFFFFICTASNQCFRASLIELQFLIECHNFFPSYLFINDSAYSLSAKLILSYRNFSVK